MDVIGRSVEMMKSINRNRLLLALAATATMVILSCSRKTTTNSPPRPEQPGNHPGIQVELNVPAPMRDGVKLLADVFTPDGPGPFPVLLSRTPYDKETPGTIESGIAGAEQGFIMVNMDVRGRYHSPGFWEPFKYEINDGYDSVEWAAKLPKSDGKVGMWGGSYVGATQWLAAVSDPPHLAGICPEVTAQDYYKDWAYQNGALQQWFAQSWATQTASDALWQQANFTFSAAGYVPSTRSPQTGLLTRPGQTSMTDPLNYIKVLPLGNYTTLVTPPTAGNPGLKALEPWYLDWLAHPSDDAYWQQWSISKDYSRIHAPAFIIGGWYDLFLGGSLENYEGVKAHGGSADARNDVQLMVIPGGHSGSGSRVGALDLGRNAIANTFQIMLDWYKHLFLGQSNAVSQWEPVRYFQMGADVWRQSSTWPPPQASTVAYYLHSAGKANTDSGNGSLSAQVNDPNANAASDRFVYDPADPVPTLGGSMCCDGADVPNGIQDQRPDEKRPDVLVFTTPPLQKNLDITGPVSMTLYVSSSAPDTDFTAVLVDVAPDGSDHNIAAGIQRMRYRDQDYTKATFMTPGQIYKVNLDLWATSNVFLAGHRLRVDVSSSNFPRWDRNLNTKESPESGSHFVKASNVIYHDAAHPSSLDLPVMPQ